MMVELGCMTKLPYDYICHVIEGITVIYFPKLLT